MGYATAGMVALLALGLVWLMRLRGPMLTLTAAALLFGCAPARLRGAAVDELLSPDTASLLLRDLDQGRPRVLETCLVTKSRTQAVRTIKITATPLAGRHARFFTLLLIEDISEKARLEQQLVDSETQAAMAQLAAGLLHEVSNPLSSLGSNLMFVREALPAETSLEVTQALDASLDQLEQMRQLLATLSRLPGRAVPRYERADLHQVIRQCATFIARDADRRGISVDVRCPAESAPCEMDVRLIKQVLLNLFKNAMEAMPDGGRLSVGTSPPEADDEPGSLVIKVADTGIGIAEADLRRVFRPLFSTKRRGAGLGLSFCRQAVEEHGGAIRITTGGKNQGTTVFVSLPASQPTDLDE
jgi:two-component system sensor histidine kinase HydH